MVKQRQNANEREGYATSDGSNGDDDPSDDGSDDNDDDPSADGSDNGDGLIGDVEEHKRNTKFDSRLSKLHQLIEDDSRNDETRMGQGGTRYFQVSNKIVFLTQAESYHHRGPNFPVFSLLEFKLIVDLIPRRAKKQNTEHIGPGRPCRDTFELAKTHPLFQSHQAVIRCKFLTAKLGGAPPPPYPSPQLLHGEDNSQYHAQMDLLARYLLCLFVPWTRKDFGPDFQLDSNGLAEVCRQWDRHDAPLIERQRYRYIHNVMKKGHRHS